MGRFLEDAQNIFEAAESASRSGHVVSDVTILIGAGGGVHMLADSDWPLDRLMAHHGAQTVYRISERNGKVRVEGRAGTQSCLLEANPPARLGGRALSAFRRPGLHALLCSAR